MATDAIASPKAESFGHRAIALIPGLLLLAAVGYAGKFIEQSIAVYTKVPPHHVPQYRICSVGHRHRPDHRQHYRHSAHLSGRRRNL